MYVRGGEGAGDVRAYRLDRCFLLELKFHFGTQNLN